MKIYIINLKLAIKRREFQEKQFARLDLTDYEFFNAISSDDIDEKTYQKHYYAWQRPLEKSEIACFFSHQVLWKKIINNNQPALILEDDAILSKDVPKIIQQLKSLKNTDMIDIEAYQKSKYLSKTKRYLMDDYTLSKIYFNSAGAGAYVLYPSGAKKLLQHQKRYGIAPSDAYIAHCRQLISFQLESALSIQARHANEYCLTGKYKLLNDENRYDKPMVLTSKKAKRHPIFLYKKLISESKLGCYKIQLFFIADKCSIFIKKQDFE